VEDEITLKIKKEVRKLIGSFFPLLLYWIITPRIKRMAGE